MALLIVPLFTAGIAVGGIQNANAGVPEPKTIVVDLDGEVGHSSPRNIAQCDGTRITGDDVETSIQNAIGAANPGDTIIVCPDSYGEAVLVDKSDITVKGIAQPIVDGSNASPAFTITEDGVHLTGFEAKSTDSDCIRVNADDVRIHGNIASGCGENGITVNGDRNTISGNTVNLNEASGIVVNRDDNTIRGNIVNGNMDGSGIEIVGDDNTIQGNTANGNDVSGMFFRAPSEDNSVKANTANDNTNFGYEDEGTNNDFSKNKCRDNIDGGSSPGGLCKPQG